MADTEESNLLNTKTDSDLEYHEPSVNRPIIPYDDTSPTRNKTSMHGSFVQRGRSLSEIRKSYDKSMRLHFIVLQQFWNNVDQIDKYAELLSLTSPRLSIVAGRETFPTKEELDEWFEYHITRHYRGLETHFIREYIGWLHDEIEKFAYVSSQSINSQLKLLVEDATSTWMKEQATALRISADYHNELPLERIEQRYSETIWWATVYLGKIYLYPGSPEIPKWQRRVYDYCHDLPTIEGSGLRPTAYELCCWFFGAGDCPNAVISDSIEDAVLEGFLDRSGLNCLETTALEFAETVMWPYVYWLNGRLSQVGHVSRDDVVNKVISLLDQRA